MPETYCEIEIAKLPLGISLRFPVLQDNNLLLLAEGTVITPRIVELLQARGVHKVRVHPVDLPRRDAEEEQEDYAQPIEPPTAFYRRIEPRYDPATRSLVHFRTAASRRLDDEIAERGVMPRQSGTGRVYLVPPLLKDLEAWHEAVRDREERDHEIATRVESLQYQMLARWRIDPEPLLRILESQVQQLGKHVGLFCYFARPPSAATYPARHGMLVARLAMAVAAYLGWSREELLGLGLGAFCHDVGMLRIPDKLYRTRARISSVDWHTLAKHPIHALDLVAEVDVHPYVKYVVYQTHERCNGTGYPRHRTQDTIHPAARLAGLVDAFVAMISARPHRNPLLPHQAILEIIQETHAGYWDPAMTRGLVRAVSLYPLGSFVELADGRIGRSVQTHETDHRRPRLEVWSDPAAIAHERGEILDLAEHPTIHVLRAIAPPQWL